MYYVLSIFQCALTVSQRIRFCICRTFKHGALQTDVLQRAWKSGDHSTDICGSRREIRRCASGKRKVASPKAKWDIDLKIQFNDL